MPNQTDDDPQDIESSGSSNKNAAAEEASDPTRVVQREPFAEDENQQPKIDIEINLCNRAMECACQFPLMPAEAPGSIGRFQTYDVMEVVGRGGMGVVFRAFDRQLHRNVAIKAMSEKLMKSETARKRFIREARSAAAINHANVVSIYAAGEEAGYPFLAMEFVNGKTLEDRIQAESPLDITDALRISSQIASGLAAAHRQGVIHRDIKPSNILIVDQIDRIKISDFGLALLALEQTDLTSLGDVVGTPSFMAPEQINGDDITPATDLFSLGVVIYTMFLGRSPFRVRGNLAALQRINDYHPPMLHEQFPQVPAKLGLLVAQLMDKNPKKRPQSAEQVADEILRISAEQNSLDNNTTVAIGMTRRNSGVFSPRSVGWGLAAAAAAGLAALALGWPMINSKPNPTSSTPVTLSANHPEDPKAASILADQIIYVGGPESEVETIDEALNLAIPGTTIRLHEGRYRESVKITRPAQQNLKLIGVGEVLLEAAVNKGPVVEVHDVSGVEIKHVRIRAFPSQIGMDVQGSGIGLQIEDCHFESVNPQAARLPLLHWHHGRAAEISNPSSIRECLFKAGGVGVVLGDAESSKYPPLKDIEISNTILTTVDRSLGIPLVLQSSVEQITIAANTVSHGQGAMSFVFDFPGSARKVRIVNNSFHDFDNVCYFNTSDPQQEIEIANNVFVDVSTLHAVVHPPLSYQPWFNKNAFVASQTVIDPLPAFFSTSLSRSDFISLDPENPDYLHPREPVSANFPGRFR